MKRMNKTAIALATAGALGFAVVPMAGAQDAQTLGDLDPNANEAYVPDNQPAMDPLPSGLAEQTGPTGREKKESGTPAGVNVEDAVKSENPYPGSSQPLPSGLTEQSGPNIKDKVERGTPAGVNVEDAVKSENPYPGSSQPLPSGLTEQPGETFKESEYIKKTVDGKTQMLFVGPDGKTVWHNIDANNQPIGADGNRITGLKPAKAEDNQAEENKNLLPIVLGVLGGLAGLGLVIAGVNYWVNKDGNLVTDPGKVNEPSSPADAENTQKIVGENAEEVAKQLGIDPATGEPVNGPATGDPATGGERGIGASTGVNKIPGALLSLVLASVLGAAAFAFGRRQLV